MDIARDIDNRCDLLNSSKITTRRQACDDLYELLTSKSTIEILNEAGAERWQRILVTLQTCMVKEIGGKKNEDKASSIALKIADLFVTFTCVAVKERAGLNYRKLLNFVLDYLRDPSKKCYHCPLLKTISHNSLMNPNVLGLLHSEDWENLYAVIKSFYLKQSQSDYRPIKCLAVIFKLGPLYSFPVSVFREEADFVISLCKTITSSTQKPEQEATLELTSEFCKHASKDSRMACCKLGEEVLLDLMRMYKSNANDVKMKAKLVDFFLLQVVIHHPNGAKEKQPASYAVTWGIWKQCLFNIYTVLTSEIEASLTYACRDRTLFVRANGIEMLHDSFVRLFGQVCLQLFDDNCLSYEASNSEEQPHKKARLDISLRNLIENIQNTKSWTWINLTYPLIETDPAIITRVDYLTFFKILTAILQTETKDATLLYHVYKALITLEKIEIEIDKTEMEQQWQIVIDSALRSINNEHIQTLLQSLVSKKILNTHENLLQNYRAGGVLSASISNLKTLDVAFKTFPHLQFENNLKIDIMQWILGSNPECFGQSYVAEILIYLILKQWPDCDTHEVHTPKKHFDELEDVYLATSLEKLVHSSEMSKDIKTTPTSVFCVDQNLFSTLTEFLKNLIRKNDGNAENSLYVAFLIFNFLSYLVKYDLIATNITDLSLFETLENNTRNIFANLNISVNKSDERSIVKIAKLVNILNVFFTVNVSALMSKKLREWIPQDLIKAMFEGLRSEFEEKCETELLAFKRSIIEALASFSCLPQAENSLEMQKKALECLVVTEYDCSNDADYEMVLTLLHSIKSCNVPLEDETALSIFNLFRNVCEFRYQCYPSAVKILELFYEIYQLVPASQICRSQFVQILYPFYMGRFKYGPGVSVCLLNCMGLLYELEPSCTHSKWSNKEIVLKIPEFLNSDFQEVRLAAISNVAKFFRISSRTRLLQHFHQQEIMFSKISDMSLEVFKIEGGGNKERIIDETVTRTASILHTYASIMTVSYLWLDEALFTLLKQVCDKNISLNQVNKIIEMVARKLGFENGLKLLEKHLIPLFSRWKCYDIDRFPFSIFKCDSKIQFYRKYWNLLAHIVVEIDRESVDENLIKNASTKLLSHCIAQEVLDFDALKNNKTYHLLNSVLGSHALKDAFEKQIDEIFFYLIDFVSDEIDFNNKFDENVIFLKANEGCLTVQQFTRCIQYIENLAYEEENMLLYLARTHPDKIHRILLQLSLKIDDSEALEEKLRYLHLYSITVLLCIESVKSVLSIQPYFIRFVTHTLLHLIKNNGNQPELSQISCKFLKIVLEKLVPDLKNTLKQFFLVIVSRLKSLALEKCHISNMCVDMLQFLIVEHGKFFIDELEKLDSIPKTPKFETIFRIHYGIKYHKREVTLEDEIKQFLDFATNTESFDECEHSLKHLKSLLETEKGQLQSLYTSLRQSRGFSEDCQDSSLHQLICMLINLSSSTNKNVCTEAVRCLGEIGPAHLATLILQPEKAIPDPKWAPFELLLGYSLSLLSKYVVDCDVNVIRASSNALFQILSIKQGRKVAESGTDFGFGVINCSYLRPFFSEPSKKSDFNVNVNGDDFLSKINDDELWISSCCCHKSWITRLVSTLLETFQESVFFSSFIDVCKLKTEFCEQILPLVIHLILSLNITAITNSISLKLESFFTKHWDITVLNNKTESITVNRSSVQCMLNVVHFIRLQKSIRSKKQAKDISLDYLKVAKGAHFCTAHFTALLYAELWCQEQINLAPDDYNISTCSSTKLDLIYEKVDEITGRALYNIQSQAYKAVGEVDALLGCGTSFLLNPECRVEHYRESGRWDLVINHYAMEVSRGVNASLLPLVASLNNAKWYELSQFCSGSLEEADYESLWRLGQWDYNRSVKNSRDTCDKYKFQALKALNDSDEFSFLKSLDNARMCIVQDLSAINLESSNHFYSILTQLQSFKEVEDFSIALSSNQLAELLNKWALQDEITQNDFRYIEPIRAQRMVLLREFSKKHTYGDNLRNTSIDFMLQFAELARVEGNTTAASRTLKNLLLLPNLSKDVIARIQLEEAQLCWSLQDVVLAKGILRQLCIDENVNPKLHAMALKMAGKWMIESSSESRETIIENYFQKSLDLLKRIDSKSADDEKSIQDTFNQLAKFADREYQQVMSHIKSDIFQRKKRNILKTMQAVNEVRSKCNLKKETRDLQKAVALKEKLSSIDQTEINNIECEKDYLLELALKYYLRNLIRSDDYNITIFRLISLLLENRSNEVVSTLLENNLMKIPTYKFITILPQIIPHISSVSKDLFCQTIDNVIEKCAKEHPYHTLPLILSLALSNKDREYAESKAVVNDARMQSAKNLLKRLRKQQNLTSLIAKMENLSEALIEFAYYKGTDGEGGRLSKRSKLRSIQNYDDVLLPTCSLPVDKSCAYKKIVGISSFGDTYNNVGGINAPKRITCRGTDGLNRLQLVKGQDDLRQDAVMQQVFTIMNSLLALNKQTKNLLIRTYKVVPLSMRSGILEWVDNTIPIGEYLTGKDGNSGAHSKYRPEDRAPKRCRDDFRNSGKLLPNDKLRAFNGICKNIKPVFHKFFETTFPQPTLWYERRRAYIHSVATSSMCGYILGIGDRHVNNILIDKSTAEVVHIDFGIAFEQGKVLPTPETVPFRLTRDVVDGMGVTGVEGVFRRSCEKTMEVLRLHHQTIVTILEVLLYDPLYDWTVSSAEANKRQKDEQDDSDILNMSMVGEDDASKDVNVTAERALLRLKDKLQGTENGKFTTVENQVATLIQQAVDPANLCKLFNGWQPYL